MKREEAIDIIRKNIPHLGIGATEMTGALNELIPELRESEDERIRKEIIHYLVHTAGGLSTEEQHRWITYLEKQKENPKSADSISADCVSSAKCEDRSPKHTDSFGTDIRDTPAYWRGWDDAMKQKEQKPAWSEVELLFRGEKVMVKRPFYRDDKGRGYSTAELDEDVAWNALRAWCEKKGISLYDLYPKAEWSEEDEKMLDAMIDIVSGTFYEPLCPRKEMLAWLKRIRPSWKPSEEQLNALNFAITYMFSTKANPTVLRDLYDDLLKLK